MEISGTTCFCAVYNQDTLLMVYDGRMSYDRTRVATDNEDKFHIVAPKIFALAAGNFRITSKVVNNLKGKGFLKNKSVTIHTIADIMLNELKEVTEKSNKKKEGASEDQTVGKKKGYFLVAGFENASPFIYQLKVTFARPKRILNSAGLGNGWAHINAELTKHDYLLEKDETRVLESVEKCMIEALLREMDSGGMVCIQRMTKHDKKPRVQCDEHIVNLYYKHYSLYEVKDEKETLFLVCPVGTPRYSIIDYFKLEFGLVLSTSHVLCWIEDKIGLKGKYQFRRVRFASRNADEVHRQLSQIPSTQVLEVDSSKFLKISIDVTGEEEGQQKSQKKEQIEIFVLRASKNILGYIISGGYETLLPPEKR